MRKRNRYITGVGDVGEKVGMRVCGDLGQRSKGAGKVRCGLRWV